MVRVKATRPGYYGQLRAPGDVFEVSGEKAVSKHWMVRADAEKPAKSADIKPAEKPTK